MDEVKIGRIAKLSGMIVFVDKDTTVDVEKKSRSEVEIGDFVVGYIHKAESIGMPTKFKLIAKTKKQKITKRRMMGAIISFVKLNRNELGVYGKWRALIYENIFSIKRNANLVLARHLFMFLNRFMTNKTLQNVAKECKLDKSNHTNVIYGEKHILNELSINPSFAAYFQGLINDCTKKE